MAERRRSFSSNGTAKEEPRKVKISKESLREALVLFTYLKPYRAKFILSLVFIALSAAFPESLHAVYGLNEPDTITTGILSKKEVIGKFTEFKTELTQDGNISFGLLQHSSTALVELTVTESKYIKFWGMDKAAFLTCMAGFSIPQRPRLEFIDEYPKVVEPLNKFVPNARKPEEVIKKLNSAFGMAQ